MNEIFLVGRLIKDLAILENDYQTIKFTLAINDSKNYQKTFLVNCVAYNTQAEFIIKTCKKGSLVFIKGRYTSWIENQKLLSVIVVDLVQLLATKPNETIEPSSFKWTDKVNSSNRNPDELFESLSDEQKKAWKDLSWMKEFD